MAFTRVIRQNFFIDPEILAEYNIKERYFIIGLVCNADDYGRFWYNSKLIQTQIFPTDEEISFDWVDQALKKLVNDGILCFYEVSGKQYVHFPLWFEIGWYLKQRIDHPREHVLPDCPICLTEAKTRNKREINEKFHGQLKISQINQIKIIYWKRETARVIK